MVKWSIYKPYYELFRNVPNTEAQNVLPERSERAVVGVPASFSNNVPGDVVIQGSCMDHMIRYNLCDTS